MNRYEIVKSMREREGFRRDIRMNEELLPTGYWKYIFRYHLIGHEGAAVFIFHILTKDPKEVEEFIHGRWERFDITPIGIDTPNGHIMSSDLGFHSRKPRPYPWVHHEQCEVVEGECWYDADGLPAMDLFRKFIQTLDTNLIWDKLHEVYERRSKEDE